MLQKATKVYEVQDFISLQKSAGKKIGFVPTMGALHQGHLSLIEKSNTETDVTVCSIFVNPTQFNNAGDFNRYPRNIEEDLEMLSLSGCDFVFFPMPEEMYPDGEFKTINFHAGSLGEVMEGKHRPGHFEGVAAVVKRLFDIVNPDIAFFGLKDFQQVAIIKKMVADFNLSVKIIGCPTIREMDGLAMSSRNKLLNADQRIKAAFIYKILKEAVFEFKTQPAKAVIQHALADFAANGSFAIDYFDICSAETLLPITNYTPQTPAVICIAAYLGEVRLIDNMQVD
ncbi:MAG: pantoate--beta-alanine ligase [Bacteroidetes bacterium]|nr:pantoate--beta-alanine ligase [Bacteroidota bacterium]